MEQPIFAGLSSQDINLILNMAPPCPPAEQLGTGDGGYLPRMEQPIPSLGHFPQLPSMEILKAISQASSVFASLHSM
jgi:hypothetical protein